MTLDHERLRAIKWTRRFLLALLNPQETPRVPKEIRRLASGCLKHFPDDWWVEQIEQGIPGGWGNLEVHPRLGE